MLSFALRLTVPYPPPPGVVTVRTSPPFAERVVFEDKLVILFLRTIPYTPGDPDFPPNNPKGPRRCRSPINDIVDPSANTSVSLLIPNPPRDLPRPPVP